MYLLYIGLNQCFIRLRGLFFRVALLCLHIVVVTKHFTHTQIYLFSYVYKCTARRTHSTHIVASCIYFQNIHFFSRIITLRIYAHNCMFSFTYEYILYGAVIICTCAPLPSRILVILYMRRAFLFIHRVSALDVLFCFAIIFINPVHIQYKSYFVYNMA